MQYHPLQEWSGNLQVAQSSKTEPLREYSTNVKYFSNPVVKVYLAVMRYTRYEQIDNY